MPSDEERREVAAALRALGGGKVRVADVLDEFSIDFDPYPVGCTCDAEDVEHLADLIDRPTCKNIASDPCVFRCSRCGCWTDRLAYFGLPEDEAEALKAAVCEFAAMDPADVRMTAPHTCVPRYCPTCGAEVAR